MKQPELGKKIAELRKTQRLTQEELVDKCNISIRTIQRIEAGEVTPRDYTIKTILSALDYDIEEIAPAEEEQTYQVEAWLSRLFMIKARPTSAYLIRQLNLAMVLAIVYFILRFVESLVDYSRFSEEAFIGDNAIIFVKAALMLSVVFVQRGFVIIGSIFKNHLLQIISSVIIIAQIVVIGIDIASVRHFYIEPEILVFIYAITFGVTGVIFGYALIKTSSALGRSPKVAGAFEIIAACFSLTVILSFIGSFLLMPAELLEILILYKAIAAIRKKEAVTA
ncbi:MAG: hypothetical protein Roseis2KO_48600 [Roseivirga sp.]